MSLAIDARRFDKAQSSHLQVPHVHVVKLWHCQPQFTSTPRIFATYFASQKLACKNKLLQITAAKCWFRHCYDTKNYLSTAATVCDHERETAESTALPFQISGFDETNFTADLPQATVSGRRCNSRRQLRFLSGC